MCDLQALAFTYPPSCLLPLRGCFNRIAESEANSQLGWASDSTPLPIPTAGPVSSATETRIRKEDSVPFARRDHVCSSPSAPTSTPALRSPLVAGLSPAAAGASRLWGHRTRLHPLDRAPPPPAAGLTPRLSPLGPGELAVERRGCRRPAGGATAGESCSSSSPSPLADPSVLIPTAGEKTHKLCYGGWFISHPYFFCFRLE